MEVDRIILIGKREVLEKTYRIATSSNTNLIINGQSLKPGRRGEKLTTNGLNQGTDFKTDTQ
jgi:hypothetical protein